MLLRRPMRVLVSMTGLVVVTYVAYRLIPVSSSPVHCCCFSCSQRSEPPLPRISSEEIQKGHNQ